jgi:hypothetical protein
MRAWRTAGRWAAANLLLVGVTGAVQAGGGKGDEPQPGPSFVACQGDGPPGGPDTTCGQTNGSLCGRWPGPNGAAKYCGMDYQKQICTCK